ncbi:hypothetical protein I552_6575 [Mycobacterium xenopi 3993]|nr:hypothetical protein I552_6575 [Mycobacterium xenopi 3993]
MSRTHQFLVTLTVHTNKINPANKPTTTSANSMTNKTAVVVTRRDGQQEVPASNGRRCRCPRRVVHDAGNALRLKRS